MLKILLLLFFCLTSPFAQQSLVRLNKSTLLVIGGEFGFDFPFESVKYLPNGEYHSVGGSYLKAYGFQFGLSIPFMEDKSTHIEFNLMLPRSISEIDWPEKYPINSENGNFEGVYITEKNKVSALLVNSRLYRYMPLGRQTMFLSFGAGVASISRTRTISTMSPDNIYNSMYTPDGTTESAFHFNVDGGVGVLLRLDSSKYLRIGYRAGILMLPEQPFYNALVPYSSSGYLITNHLTANLLFRL